MPAWIHNRAEHLMDKNPDMKKSTAFAIATQQAYGANKAPSNFGTAKGKKKADRKYDKPAKSYEQKADPKSHRKLAYILAALAERDPV